jgi:hypothetical protein
VDEKPETGDGAINDAGQPSQKIERLNH